MINAVKKFIRKYFLCKLYFYDDGQCYACPNCQGHRIYEKVLDWEQNYPCEVLYYCDDCKINVSYWNYGYFDYCYLMDYIDNGKLNPLSSSLLITRKH